MSDSLRVSATLFTTWKRCPAQAAARVAGHYPPDTIASFRGLLAHRVFARHINEGPIAPGEFDRTCRAEIGASQLNWKMADLGLKPAQVTAVIHEVGDLYRRFTTIAPKGTAEVHVEYPITTDVTLIGTIDCVTGSVYRPDRLVDWKTGELGDVSDQLAFYALAWTGSGLVPPLGVEAVSVTTGERYEAWVNRQTLAATAADVASCVADLTTEGYDPEPEPGPWCRWCPILDDCPAGQRTVQLIG